MWGVVMLPWFAQRNAGVTQACAAALSFAHAWLYVPHPYFIIILVQTFSIFPYSFFESWLLPSLLLFSLFLFRPYGHFLFTLIIPSNFFQNHFPQWFPSFSLICLSLRIYKWNQIINNMAGRLAALLQAGQGERISYVSCYIFINLAFLYIPKNYSENLEETGGREGKKAERRIPLSILKEKRRRQKEERKRGKWQINNLNFISPELSNFFWTKGNNHSQQLRQKNSLTLLRRILC